MVADRKQSYNVQDVEDCTCRKGGLLWGSDQSDEIDCHQVLKTFCKVGKNIDWALATNFNSNFVFAV